MGKKFKVGDEAIAQSDNLNTGYYAGKSYKVLSVVGSFIEICTDYGRYEKVPAIFFTKG